MYHSCYERDRHVFTRQRVHRVVQTLELCTNEIAELSELCYDAPPLIHLGLGFNQLTDAHSYLTAHYWSALRCLVMIMMMTMMMMMMMIHVVEFNEFSRRSFSCLARTVLNVLPLNIRLSHTFDTFKRRLKTHLFN